MNAKEALGILEGAVSDAYDHVYYKDGDEWYRKATNALAVLADLAEECERLKQKWVDSMGDHVAVSVEAEELQARAEKVEAECEKWCKEAHRQQAECERLRGEAEQDKALIKDLTQDMNEYHDKAEKAEAEASDAQVVMKAMMIEIDNLKAELARYRRFDALIEAAEKASHEWIAIEIDELSRIRTGDTPTMKLLRTALKCREEK